MRWIAAGVVVLVLSTAVSSHAGQGRGRGKHAQGDDQGEQASSRLIGKTDERVIREWFSQPSNLRGLPPGLAKKETLPPGLQKQLVRNGQLPPGLQKKIQPMPPVLEERLSPLPEGTKRFVINGSIVLLDQHKNLILDIVAAF
jgi:hypothetical protein